MRTCEGAPPAEAHTTLAYEMLTAAMFLALTLVKVDADELIS